MTMRILFPHHWQTQKWLNGGGITHELIKDDVADWRYRLSIAEVAQDGPFSRFDGIDRIIMLLSGKGFELYFGGGHLQSMVTALQPFPFRGDDPVNCELIDGPVRDFNVMTRRGVSSAHVEMIALTRQRQSVVVGGLIHFVFGVQGQVFAELNEHGYLLDAEQMLIIEGETAPLQLSGLSDGAMAYSIAISTR